MATPGAPSGHLHAARGYDIQDPRESAGGEFDQRVRGRYGGRYRMGRSDGGGGTRPGRGVDRGSAGDAEAAGGRVNFVDGADRSSLSVDRDSIIWHQKHDKDCRALVHHLKFKKWPKFCSPALKKEDINNFALRDGILCVQGQTGAEQRIVWPRAKRFEMLYQHHDLSHHGHCGHEKLYEKLSRHIWYVGLKRDCKNYVDSCKRCSEKKDDRGPAPPPLLPQPTGGPGDVLVIDIVHMPSSRLTGKTLVLTCVDKFTGFLTHYPLQSGTADDVADALTTQFLKYGPPQHIETDAGANLKSQKVSDLCKFWGVTLRHSVGYHHEAIGKVERRHRDNKRRLRTLTDSYGVD